MAIHVCLLDGAGCGGCALEAQAALTARYGAARRGIRMVESPAHADVLLLCGPLSALLSEQVLQLESLLQRPWVRLQMGDCAVEEAAGPILAGCPPAPEAILAAIVAAWRQRSRQQHQGSKEEQT